jgi:hypothetical protein
MKKMQLYADFYTTEKIAKNIEMCYSQKHWFYVIKMKIYISFISRDSIRRSCTNGFFFNMLLRVTINTPGMTSELFDNLSTMNAITALECFTRDNDTTKAIL